MPVNGPLWLHMESEFGGRVEMGSPGRRQGVLACSEGWGMESWGRPQEH